MSYRVSSFGAQPENLGSPPRSADAARSASRFAIFPMSCINASSVNSFWSLPTLTPNDAKVSAIRGYGQGVMSRVMAPVTGKLYDFVANSPTAPPIECDVMSTLPWYSGFDAEMAALFNLTANVTTVPSSA